MVLGVGKVPCLERCPQFRTVMEVPLYIHKLYISCVCVVGLLVVLMVGGSRRACKFENRIPRKSATYVVMWSPVSNCVVSVFVVSVCGVYASENIGWTCVQ